MAATDTPPKRRTRGQGEGSIYQRASDGKWVASTEVGWQDGTRKRKRKYFYGETRAEVATKLTEALAKQQRGQKIVYERQTVGQWLDRWHAEQIAGNRAQGTDAAYRRMIDNHLVPALGDTQLATLAARDVQSLVTRLRRAGLAAGTINNILMVLRMALDRAERLELVPRNVARQIDRERMTPFIAAPFTLDETRAFLAALGTDPLAALYALSIRRGLRQGEALGLRWTDVDLDAGVLHVRQQLLRGKPALGPLKTGPSHRDVVLTDPLIAILRAHNERQADSGDRVGALGPLVWRRPDGRPLATTTLGETFRAACAKNGLAQRRWHDLRHTCTGLLYEADVSERVIAETLGHAPLGMTRRYGRLSVEVKRRELAKLDALLDT